MGHNSVVSGYPKSTGIPQIDRLSTKPPGFGASQGMVRVKLWKVRNELL